MALLAAQVSQPELAIRLAAAATVHLRAIGGVLPVSGTEWIEKVVDSARQSLGDRAAALQAEGGALTLDQAAALA